MKFFEMTDFHSILMSRNVTRELLSFFKKYVLNFLLQSKYYALRKVNVKKTRQFFAEIALVLRLTKDGLKILSKMPFFSELVESSTPQKTKETLVTLYWKETKGKLCRSFGDTKWSVKY